MDGFVALENLVLQLPDLQFVHRLDVVVGLLISLVKVLELSLQFLELSRDPLIFLGEVLVI